MLMACPPSRAEERGWLNLLPSRRSAVGPQDWSASMPPQSIATARDRSDQAWSVIPERPAQFAGALHQSIVCDGKARPDSIE
jgi:hypothetical protein